MEPRSGAGGSGRGRFRLQPIHKARNRETRTRAAHLRRPVTTQRHHLDVHAAKHMEKSAHRKPPRGHCFAFCFALDLGGRSERRAPKSPSWVLFLLAADPHHPEKGWFGLDDRVEKQNTAGPSEGTPRTSSWPRGSPAGGGPWLPGSGYGHPG